MKIYNVFCKPYITEKTQQQKDKLNKYVFLVHPNATKVQIKDTFIKMFGVVPFKINTLTQRPQKKRIGKYSGWTAKSKKAIITLHHSDTLNIDDQVNKSVPKNVPASKPKNKDESEKN